MKTYKSSDLTHKRAEVLKEAKLNGVIIQERNTNGEVREEYVIVSKSYIKSVGGGDIAIFFNSGEHLVKG
jgi:hypothetical protein